MADIVIRQIEEGMTGRQVADLLYSNFLALVGAIGSGGGGDIPVADIEKGVTAYGWGDHRQAGYLKGITGGMVTGALGYTPMDEAAWTKANIKATLGIADWALAASKPTYTTKEVAEDGNLYFTDARAVAALAGVTDALAGDIGANATAIGVLQGYFTNGVAKSAAKLATSRKIWGQSFDGTAAVSGALTGVTDITASGTLTIGKIKIGDGVIEWDAANGGFKVTGGLWATDYLSSKGVNTGASGGGGGGSSYQRLDTWDGYTTEKDGWVLSAKLGYGLKTTQDDILRQLANITGQGTNVTFTPSLTSGTQIGTLTIDGEPVKMYAPSIPTSDIEKGVTAYGWGNHASVGYLTKHQDLSGYQTKITSSNKLTASLVSGLAAVATSGKYSDLSGTPTSLPASDVSAWAKAASKPTYKFSEITEKPTTIGGYGITDAYTKSQVDSALGGYLPLSGGTLTGKVTTSARIAMNGSILEFRDTDGSFKAYMQSYEVGNLSIYNGSTWNTIIHSGNIGSQSVANATSINNISIVGANVNNSTSGYWSGLGYGSAKKISIGSNYGGIAWRAQDYCADIMFGCPIDTHGFISIGHSEPIVSFAGSNNSNASADNPNWYWKLTGTSGTTYDLNCAPSATKLQTARTIWGQSFDGTGNVSGAAMGLGGAIDFQFSDEINRYGGTLYLQNRGDGSQAGTGGNATGNVVMCKNGGNVLIGTSTDNGYKLDVNGILHASGAVTFDSTLSVTSTSKLMGNVGIGVAADNNKLCVHGVIRSTAYSAIGNNNAAFVFDKPSSYFTGIGANGVADTIYFGACNTSGAWVTDYYQKWHFNGEVYAKTGIWSDGYVSAKGQNTSSDMRLKRVLEEVTLSVEDIAAAPAFRFEWKGGAGVDVGTSAQYWEKVLPDAVKRDDAGWRMMQYGNVAMVALISLARRVKELEEQLKIKN